MHIVLAVIISLVVGVACGFVFKTYLINKAQAVVSAAKKL